MELCGRAIHYLNPASGTCGAVPCELQAGHDGPHDAPSTLLLRPADTIYIAL